MHTDFVCYTIENYKNEHNFDGRTVIAIFDKFGIIEYLEECFPALHTTSPKYINWSIDEYISSGQNAAADLSDAFCN